MFRNMLDWFSSDRQAKDRKTRKRHSRRDRFQKTAMRQCRLEPLEARWLLAFTSFDNGILTIDFDQADEIVTVNNDGTNITLTSSTGIDGLSSFATAVVNGIVVTDPDNQANQVLIFQDGTPFSLSEGLSVSGVETVTFHNAVTATGTSGIAVTAPRSIVVDANLIGGSDGVSLTGQGTAALDTTGVFVTSQATISTTGNGPITIIGTGGAGGGSSNRGIDIVGGKISSGGDIELVGQGGTGTGGVAGINLFSSAQIEATGLGSITMTGIGGTGTGWFVEGVGIQTSTITAEDGSIVITGTGGAPGAGLYDSGVRLADGSITTTGSGNIEVTGTAGSGTVENYGISMGGDNAAISATGSGNISLTGTHGANAATTSGVQLGKFGPMSIQQTGSGWLEIIGDRVMIDESDAAIGAAGNTVTLRPKTNGQAIELGGDDSAAQLGLTDGELDRITAGTLQIGDNNSGTITVSQPITRDVATDLHLATGANIAFSGSGSLDSADGDVTLTAGGTGAITSGAAASDINAGAGAIMLTAGSGGIGASGNPLVVASSHASALTALTSGNANQFLAANGSISVSALDAGLGTITLADGTFKLSSPGALPDRRLVVNGQLDLNGHSPSIGGLDGSGTVTSGAAGNAILTVGTINQGGNFSGVIEDGGGTVGLTKVGGGVQQLTGNAANTFTGAISINAGTLALGKTAGINAVGSALITIGDNSGTSDALRLDADNQIPDTATVVLNATSVGTAATFDLNGHSETIGALSSAVSTMSRVTNAAAETTSTLTIGSGDANSTFGGIIQDGDGTVVLTKTGSGVLTLSGANTYTGDTTVSDGILLVNGSTADGSSVTVQDGASLGGTGTVGGAVSAEDGGTVAPGTSTGVLATGSVAFDSGSIFAVEINGTNLGTQYDQLDVTGTVNLGGANLDVTLGFPPGPGHSFTIINNDGADPVVGEFAGLPEGATLLVDAVPLKVSYVGGDGNDVVVSFNTNPELLGTDGDDSLFVRRVGDDIEVRTGAAYPGGTVLLQTLLADLETLTIDGQGGDDTLTVDFSGGDPIPTSGLTFHGGAGGDALIITGNVTPFTDQVFHFTGKDSQGIGTGFDGTVDLDASTITFTGLEPIDGGDAVNTTFNLPDVPGNPNNDIILRNHTTAGRIEIFDNTGSDFENTNVPNPTGSLTVNLGNQGDTITLLDLDDDFAPGAAANAFVINGGSGADTFHIQSTRQADGGTYSGLVINAGDGDDVIHVGSAGNSLDFILSPVTVNGDGHIAGDALNINDQGTSTAGLVYNLTNSTVQRTGTALITYGTVESLVLNAGSHAAGDQINVQSTAAATPVTIHAGPGDDQINIGSPGNSLDAILGVVTVNGGAGDADTLNINDENNPNARLYELTSSNVAWGPTAGPATVMVNFATVESLILNASTGDDIINVRTSQAGTPVTVNASAGDDTINIGNLANSLDNILGAVTVTGGLGTDTLNINDQGDNDTADYTVTATTVDRAGAATITYSSLQAVVVNGATNPNSFYVRSTASGTPVTIYAGDGDDTIHVGSVGNSLDTILAPVFVYGDAGSNDTLLINDQGDTDVNNYVLTPSAFTRTAPTPPTTVNIFFDSTLNDLVLNADDNSTVVGQLTIGNQITVTPSLDTRFTIHGNDPAPPALRGDALFYDGPAPATKSITGLGSGTISAAGVQDVVYTGIETLEHLTPAGFVDVIDMNVIEPVADGNENVIRLVRIEVDGVDYLQVWIDTDTTDGNPEVLYSTQLYASVGQITVIGNEDDDTLIVDHSGTGTGADNGFINREITFDGNDGIDSLVITGDPGFVAARTTFLAGVPDPATDFSGTWIIDPDDVMEAGAAEAPDGTQMIVTFTRLAPVTDDTPAAIFDAILTSGADDATIASATVNTFAGLGVVSNTATFEDFFITRKDNIRLMGADGTDVFRINYSVAPVGSDGVNPMDDLEIYGFAEPDVVDPLLDDNASDRFVLFATAAGVTTHLFGQGGDDLFHNAGFFGDLGPRSLDAIEGPVIFDGGLGNDLVYLSDRQTSAGTGDTVEFDVDGSVGTITGAAPTTPVPVVLTHTNVETLFFESTPHDDLLDVLATLAGTHYILGGDGGSDAFTIGNRTANVGVDNLDGSLITDGSGTLENIQGRITIIPDSSSLTVGTEDVVFVDASGDDELWGAASIDNVGPEVITLVGLTFTGDMTRLSNFAVADIEYFHGPTAGTLGIGNANNYLEYLNVIASQGEDTIDVNATTATEFTRVDAYLGDDANTMTINGDALSANNLFMGNDGADRFVLNISADLGATAVYQLTSLEIRGDDPAAQTDARDVLEINDNSSAQRELILDYLGTQGDLDILPAVPDSGLSGAVADVPVWVRTMETVIYNGSANNNDLITVRGTPNDDLMTVALLPNNTSALFFLDGTPYLQTPPVTVAGSLPGIAGGGGGPDLRINGMDPNVGITLTGGGASGNGDRAIVYAASEDDLIDPVAQAANVDLFGFGDGVLIPGFGADQAFDTMTVDDAGVVTVNNFFGSLTTVNLDTLSFMQNLPAVAAQRPAFIVNGGDEDGVQANNVADHFTVTLSPNFNIQVNGNMPDLTHAPPGDKFSPRRGDELVVLPTSGSLNIFSDDATPVPNVSITSTGSGVFGVRYSSIERLTLDASSNGTVNIIGDNNDPAVTQNDYFRVIGRDVTGDNNGQNELQLEIGGNWDPATGDVDLSAPIFITNVTRLNVSGGHADGYDAFGNAIPFETDTGTDALDITPWADNTPRGWGVETYFNEGDDGPAGPGGIPAVDLLIYNGVPGVSEDIVIQPSDLLGGQVFSNNAATGTPVAVVNYMLNSHIIINGNDGALGDTDTLTLRGTDPANPNTSGNETVLADFTALGDGPNPMVRVYDAGPAPTDRPTAAELADTAGIEPNVIVVLQDFTNFDTINFELLGGSDVFALLAGRTDGSLAVNVNGGTAGSGNGLIAYGTADGNDRFAILAGAGSDAGVLRVQRDGAGAATEVNINGMDDIQIDGGGGSGNDALTVYGTGANNVFTVTGLPTAGTAQVDAGPVIAFGEFGSDSATVTFHGGGGSDTLALSTTDNVEEVFYTPNAANGGQLRFGPGAANDFELVDIQSVSIDGMDGADSLTVTVANAIITPTGPQSGTVAAFDASGNPLLPLTYANFPNVGAAAGAGTLVVRGTEGNDTITVLDNGDVEVLDAFGNTNTFSAASFDALVINALGGDDSITIQASTLFSGGITVIGGQGNDSLTILSETATIDVAGSTIADVVDGAISFSGIETLNVNGIGGADAFTISGYGSPTDLVALNVDGAESIDLNLTNGPDTLDFTALSMTSAALSIAAGPAISITGFTNASGALTVDGVGNMNAIRVHGSSGADLFEVSQGGAGTVVAQTVGVSLWVQLDFVNVQGLQVLAGAGDDTLTVDNTGGLVDLPNGVIFHGGDGHDTLLLVGSTDVDSSVYSVGPNVDQGTVVHTWGTSSQTIHFTGLEPVIDIVSAGTLAVYATNGDNAINYIEGPNSNTALVGGVATGMVSIDGFETIEFANKTELVINALAGNDVIHLNNPGTPMDLTTITVNGGDPTASDVVIVNVVTAAVISDLTIDGATITRTGEATVQVTGAEHLILVGDGSTNLTVEGTAGNDTIVHTPGAAADAGAVRVNSLLPISYQNLGIDATLTIDGNGGADNTLVVLGTASDDALDVQEITGNVILASRLGQHVVLRPEGIENLVLDGLSGDDRFAVNLPQPYEMISVHGGDPGSSDLLQITHESDVDETFYVYPGSMYGEGRVEIQTAGGSLWIAYQGTERLDLFGGAQIDEDSDNLVIYDDTANNQWWVTGGSLLNGVRVQIDQHAPIEYTGFEDITLQNGPWPGGFDRFLIDATILPVASVPGGTFTVAGAGADVLEAIGTGSRDIFEVVASGGPQGTVTVNNSRVQFGGLGHLNLMGLEGSDFFRIYVDDGLIEVPITIDGGGSERDALIVSGNPAPAVIDYVFYRPGPGPGQGEMLYPGADFLMSIDFVNLDQVSEYTVAGSFYVEGTDGDNAINVSDGMQGLPDSNRVSVDGFLSMMDFAYKTELWLLAGAGDDTINLNTTYAATDLERIVVVAGDPTTSDKVIVNGSPDADTIDVTLLWSNSANITGAQPVPVDVWDAELLVIQGQEGGDHLTVITPAGGDALRLIPGSEPDAGLITTRELGGTFRLPIQYAGLGADGSLTFADADPDQVRSDILEIHGTAADDRFTVAADGEVQLFRAHQDGAIFTTVPIRTPGIRQLDLMGHDGDDTFHVAGNHPFQRLIVQGGNPSASDVLNFTGSGGAVTVDLDTKTVHEDSFGPVAFSGIETLNVNAGIGSITVLGTAGPDVIGVTPTGADTATMTVAGLNLTVNTDNTGTLTVDGAGGSDLVTVHGTSGADTIDVVRGATTTVTVSGMKTIHLPASSDALTIAAGDGADTINVTGTQAGGVALTVLGGGPSSLPPLAHDRMNVTNVASGTTVYTPGDSMDSGMLSTLDGTIAFHGLEYVNVIGTGDDTYTAHGTNGPDEIALQNNGANRIWINNQSVLEFSEFSTVNLLGRFGSDTFSIDPAGLVGVTAINVDGGDPMASDSVVVNISDATTVAGLTVDGATVAMAGAALVTLTTVEHVTIAGDSSDLPLTVQTPAGAATTTTLTPGAADDAGSLQVGTAVPLRFQGLGTGGSLVMDDADVTANDTLVYLGTVGNDAFAVSATAWVTLNDRIPVAVAGAVATLTLEGLDGDDAFTVYSGHGIATINLHGGGPSASDVATLNGSGSAVNVQLGTSPVSVIDAVVTGGGLGTVNLSGIEVAHVGADGQDVTVVGTAEDDAMTYQPTGAAAGTVTKAGLNLVTHLSDVGALTIDGGIGGDNTLAVLGTAAGDTFTISPTAVLLAGLQGVDAIANVGALSVHGGEGSDTFDVTPGGIPIHIAGGDPIGVVPGDVLNLVVQANEQVTYTPGPTADSGSFQIVGTSPVSFVEIESASVTGPGAGDGATVVIQGTNGNDVITVVGTDTNDFTVSVNSAPAITYTGMDGLTINALAGDDQVVIDVNELAMADGITVDGGQPQADGDALTVSGTNARWTPSMGELVIDAQTITVLGIESLLFDGEDAHGTLTIVGSTDDEDEVFVHTPGSALDAGHVTIDANNVTQLGISYTALGLTGMVMIDGQGGADTLVAVGTSGDDAFDVAANSGDVTLTRSSGAHVTLGTSGIEALVLDGLDGNDVFTVSIPQPYATITVRGGGPGSSDLLTVHDEAGEDDAFVVTPGSTASNGQVQVNALVIDYIGVEHLQLLASGDAGDTLQVLDDGGDNHWTMSGGPEVNGAATDRIQIAGREPIDVQSFNAIELINTAGVDVFTIHPTSLSNFASLTVNGAGAGGAADTLELIGTANDDVFAQTAANQFTVNDVPVDFTAGTIETLRLVGSDGDDVFSVDLDTLAAGVARVLVEAGGPVASDVLNVTVTAGARVTQGVPSTSGVVDQTGAAEIHYTGLELLNIVSTTADSTLTVRGTNGEDTMAVAPTGVVNEARVWVNDGTVVTANTNGDENNFGTVRLEGRFGSDTFSVTPIANVAIHVDGGDPMASDSVVVNISDATTVAGLTVDGATVAMAGAALVTLTTVEHVTIAGDSSDLELTVQTPAGAATTTTLTPGAADDAGSLQVATAVPLRFQGLGTGGSLVMDDADVTANDTLVYLGTVGNDMFGVSATAWVTLNDRIPVAVAGAVATLTLEGLDGDDAFTVYSGHGIATINLHGGGPSASDVATLTGDGATAVNVQLGTSPVSVIDAVVTGGGLGTVNLSGIEVAHVAADNQNVTVSGTAEDDAFTYQPTDVDAGTVTKAGLNLVMHLSGVDELTIDGGVGGDNTLAVLGTAEGDTFTISPDAVLLASFQGVNTITNMAALSVHGGEGSDTFDVTPGGIPIHIAGGDPIGVVPGDVLNLVVQANEQVTYTPGPTADSGSFQIVGTAPVSFVEIESASVTGPGAGDGATVVIQGTNGNDVITVVGTDTNDFTVSVNSAPAVQYTGMDGLTINALAGDDQVVIDVNELAMDDGITVDGGQPQADGDALTVSGTNARWTPSMAELVIDAQTITVLGIESLLFDGQDAAGSLTVVGSTADEVFEHTPGAALDAGHVALTDLSTGTTRLGISYTALGQGGTVTVDGAAGTNRLILSGTNSSDTFGVAGVTGALSLQTLAGQRALVETANVQHLTLDGLDGDDVFTVAGNHPYTSILVEGGNPSASDVLNFLGSGAGAVTVNLDAKTVHEDNFGPVTFSGVEHVHTNTGTRNLTVLGTPEDDLFTYTPTGVASGNYVLDGMNTAFSFSNLGTSVFEVNLGASHGDHVVVMGTNSHDVITVDASNRRVDVENVNGVVLAPIVLHASVETVTVKARLGHDTVIVVPAPQAIPPATGFLPHNLLIHVDGGPPSASDALVIAGSVVRASANAPVTAVMPLDAGDFVVVNRSRRSDEGTVRVFRSADAMPDISYTDIEIVSPLVAPANPNTGHPNLLWMGPDMFEGNETRANAAYLGSGDVINVQNLTIFPNANEHRFVPADVDYFRVVAKETGTLDFHVYFRSFAENLMPGGGRLDVQVLDAVGNVIASQSDGFHHNSAPTPSSANDSRARIRIPAVQGETYYLRVFGADGETLAVNGYDLTVFNQAPPVPFDIELKDAPVDGTSNPPGGSNNSDTGRSQFDNITYDNTPTIFLRLDDAIFLNDVPGNATPPAGAITIPFNPNENPAGPATAPGFRVGVFVENNTHSEVLLGFAQPATDPLFAGPGVYQFTFTDALADGSWFISSRVQIIDPAVAAQSGWGARSQSLEIIVDTVPPNVSFGLPDVPGDGLLSDTSVSPPNYDTIADRITSETRPTFWGIAEANSIIRLYADVNGNGVFDPGTDVFLGQTTATPLDGTNQEPNGYWEIRSVIDLNDPDHFSDPDGLRTIFVSATDVAGNLALPTNENQILNIFIDTQGPQIIDVEINNVGNPYDLFDPKPSQGPTPLVNSLVISIRDLPDRVAEFLYPAIKESIASHPGHYHLVGDANGIIPIQQVIVDAPVPVGPGPVTATITLEFLNPLPDDRFTLTISDRGILDLAGNRLDGESNAAEPHEPTPPATIRGVDGVPSGDGIPGGDFVARFTIDSRPEIGVYHGGSVWVDTNGNWVFDPDNPDYTNRDIVYTFGVTTDKVFAGNFAAPGAANADGFDKLAAYGRIGNQFRWLIDWDNNGVPNDSFVEPLGRTGYPVAGNFDGNADTGDQVGLFAGGNWHFDTTHNYQLDTTVTIPGMYGIPFVGDFNGDGRVDLGTWYQDTFYISLSLDAGEPGGVGFGNWSTTLITFDFGFIGVRERPVVADFDMDGYSDIGLWVPDRLGANQEGVGEWYILVSGGQSLLNRIVQDPSTGRNTIPFTPIPFGNDIYARFGSEFAVPVVGNFDPPVAGGSGGGAGSSYTNPRDPADVNNDGLVTPQDALALINDINQHGARKLGKWAPGSLFLDVNGDGEFTPADILIVINRLNDDARSSASPTSGGEGEWSPAAATIPSVAIPLASPSTVSTPISLRAGTSGLSTAGIDRLFAESDEGEPLDDGRFTGLSQHELGDLGDLITPDDKTNVSAWDDGLDAILDELLEDVTK